MQAQFTLNQSRAEEITMREDYGCQLPSLPHDEEGFGDLGFGDSEPLEMIRDGSNVNHSLEPVRFRRKYKKSFVDVLFAFFVFREVFLVTYAIAMIHVKIDRRLRTV